MVVLVHGIDIVDVGEIRSLVNDSCYLPIPRCFVQTELGEIGSGPDRFECFAGHITAKATVPKALGAVFGGSVRF